MVYGACPHSILRIYICMCLYEPHYDVNCASCSSDMKCACSGLVWCIWIRIMLQKQSDHAFSRATYCVLQGRPAPKTSCVQVSIDTAQVFHRLIVSVSRSPEQYCAPRNITCVNIESFRRVDIFLQLLRLSKPIRRRYRTQSRMFTGQAHELRRRHFPLVHPLYPSYENSRYPASKQ